MRCNRVTRESNDAIDKFKRNLIRKHCREFRPMEVFVRIEFVSILFLCFLIGDLQTSHIV